MINARSDRFKVLTGPYFKCIERELYQRPEFIKHIPVCERPKYIEDYVQRVGGRYVETDHSAFEAHMTPEIMKAIEFQLYDYMLQYVDKHDVRYHIHQALGGKNVCKFANCTMTVRGGRMSGDMCTSLGNGFTNLMIMNYVCSKLGSKCTGVVEGDDGLFVVEGRVPTVEDFSPVGFELKLAERLTPAESHFCGMIYAEGTYENIIDPSALLCKFGWSTSQQRMGGERTRLGLLRAKALSLPVRYQPAL